MTQVSSPKTIDTLRRLKKVKPVVEDGLLPVQHGWPKRTFDIAFSFVCLTLFSPLLVVLAILVGSTSRGPIFYSSKRLGRGGRIIHCIKFRTMYRDAETRLWHLLQTEPALRKEWDIYQKLKDDPRITPIGKFLRKTSLDEFPQFWNVLKGDLSVVGPRPPALMGAPEQFLQEIRLVYGDSTKKILTVRPGITGVWQISGRSKIPLKEKRKIEEEYALNRTFWKDLVVIAKTIPAVVFSRGAF